MISNDPCRSNHRRPARRQDEHGADLVERCVYETLTYYAFPDIHLHKIRTNNPLERIMKEIRRRTRVVGAFPDGQSCLNLAAARLRYIAGTAWSTKRYMNMRPLYDASAPLLFKGDDFGQTDVMVAPY